MLMILTSIQTIVQRNVYSMFLTKNICFIWFTVDKCVSDKWLFGWMENRTISHDSFFCSVIFIFCLNKNKFKTTFLSAIRINCFWLYIYETIVIKWSAFQLQTNEHCYCTILAYIHLHLSLSSLSHEYRWQSVNIDTISLSLSPKHLQ